MCKVCCTTWKGAAYFFASAHIIDALLMIWVFIFDAVAVDQYKYYGPPFYQYDQYIDAHLAVIGVYVISLFLLGCMAFRAIEMESPKFILGVMAVYIIVQFIAFIVALVWWYPIPRVWDELGLLEAARIGRFTLRVLGTLTYVGVMAAFARKAHEEEKDMFYRA